MTEILAPIIILIATIFFTLFAKTIYGIFRAGVMFKNNFVDKDEHKKIVVELEEFKAELKEDMKSWRGELERTSLSSTKMLVDREMRQIDKVNDKLNEFNESYLIYTTRSDMMNEKLNEISIISDELIQLKKRLARLEKEEDIGGRRTLK